MDVLKGIWTCECTDAVVILRDQAKGHLLHQINFIVAWSVILSGVHSVVLGVWIGHQDQLSESANDYLSSDDRVSLEGKQDFGWSWVDGCWIGKTLTIPFPGVIPMMVSTTTTEIPSSMSLWG